MLRTATGMKQRDVAERLGVGTSSVARLEAEEVNPRLNTLLRYLGAIEKTLEDFARAMQAPEKGETLLPTDGPRREQDLTWIARELLEMRREQTEIKREFDRFREAMTLKILELGADSVTEPAGTQLTNKPFSSDD